MTGCTIKKRKEKVEGEYVGVELGGKYEGEEGA